MKPDCVKEYEALENEKEKIRKIGFQNTPKGGYLYQGLMKAGLEEKWKKVNLRLKELYPRYNSYHNNRGKSRF